MDAFEIFKRSQESQDAFAIFKNSLRNKEQQPKMDAFSIFKRNRAIQISDAFEVFKASYPFGMYAETPKELKAGTTDFGQYPSKQITVSRPEFDLPQFNLSPEEQQALWYGPAKIPATFVSSARGVTQSVMRSPLYGSFTSAMDKIFGTKLGESSFIVPHLLEKPTRIEKELSAYKQERLDEAIKNKDWKSATRIMLTEGGLDVATGLLEVTMLGSAIRGVEAIPGLAAKGKQGMTAVKALANNATKRAIYSYLTTPGNVKERTTNAVYTFAYLMTPAVAGLEPGTASAIGADIGLNSIISFTRNYPQAIEEAQRMAYDAGEPENWKMYLAKTNAAQTAISDVVSTLGTRSFTKDAVKAEKMLSDVKMVEKIGEVPKTTGEAGFVAIPELQKFQEISEKLRNSARKTFAEDRPPIKDLFNAIENFRAEKNIGGVYADWGMDNLYKLVPKTNKDSLRLIDDYLDNPKAYAEKFDKLPNEAKEVNKALAEDYEQMKQIAIDNDILEAWRENYTPHLYEDSPKRLRRVLYPESRALGKKFMFGKKRKIATKDEARKLGLHPIDDPIAKNAVYKMALYRAIAEKHFIEILKNIKREDGYPLIMGKPRNPEKLKVWENEYDYLNIKAFDRWMYVGGKDEKGMFVKIPAKADPEAKKIIEELFAPYNPSNKIKHGLRMLKGKVKRIIMLNPAIHGWNILSDVFDEVHFNPVSTYRVFKEGGKYWKEQSPVVERAVKSGLEIGAAYTTAVHLREQMLQSSKGARGLFKPLTKVEEWMDKTLWDRIVRHGQIGLFDRLSQRIAKENPNWTQEKADKTSAHYVNTLLGTLPGTWINKMGRTVGGFTFARNWTFSNIDMVVKSLTAGKRGLGVRGLGRDQQKQISKMYAKHIVKGFAALYVLGNLVQMGFLIIGNELKRRKIIKGKETPLHFTHQNESGHFWDVDTGLNDNKGRRIYLVLPLFRYIRDYIGWATDPMRTLQNKAEPVFKQTIEQIANYSLWQKKNIAPKGAPAFDKFKLRSKYFVEALTPSQYWASRPGEVRSPIEWIVPFSGTWIRRGAPGGEFTQLWWQFHAEKGYFKDKVDAKIDEHLQRGEFSDAINEMVVSGRYVSEDAIAMRFLKFPMPLNHMWYSKGKREKVEFMQWLKAKGYKINDLMKAISEERNTVSRRDD